MPPHPPTHRIYMHEYMSMCICARLSINHLSIYPSMYHLYFCLSVIYLFNLTLPYISHLEIIAIIIIRQKRPSSNQDSWLATCHRSSAHVS